MSFAAAAVVAAARRRVIESLREQGALSPKTASPLDLHRHIDRRMLDRLSRKGIIVEAGEGRYHLDLRALDAANARSRRIATGALGGLAVAAGILMVVALL